VGPHRGNSHTTTHIMSYGPLNLKEPSRQSVTKSGHPPDFMPTASLPAIPCCLDPLRRLSLKKIFFIIRHREVLVGSGTLRLVEWWGAAESS
jgi:hypothetical protein